MAKRLHLLTIINLATTMRYADFIFNCLDITDYRMSIRDQKLNSYASKEDVLQFFKEQAELAETTPFQVWRIMVAKQLAAVYKWMDGNDPDPSEPMLSRFSDLMNYMELGYALTIDHDTQAASKSSRIPEEAETKGE